MENNNPQKKDILAQICDKKHLHVEKQKNLRSEASLHNKLPDIAAPRDFIGAIKAKIAAGDNALIAEIKKASPSKGVIRADFEPSIIAQAYSNAGAACLSVLTDVEYFQGNDEYIKTAKEAVDLPVLRKDFIVDSYQLVESRFIGADCILLIMAAITDEQAAEFENIAHKLGMAVLIEVHDEEEMQRALKLKSPLIGINNRNLKTLEIDLNTTIRLAPMVPEDRIVVCESGVYSNDNIKTMNKAGVKTFLVGESLMSKNDIETATRTLLGK